MRHFLIADGICHEIIRPEFWQPHTEISGYWEYATREIGPVAASNPVAAELILRQLLLDRGDLLTGSFTLTLGAFDDLERDLDLFYPESVDPWSGYGYAEAA